MENSISHYLWHRFRAISPWYFAAAVVVLGIISLFALQANYKHMTSLRQAVYAADKNDANVEQALENLRAYVTAHMNTSLTAGSDSVYPPVQLKYTYQRLVQSTGQQNSNTNTNVYNEAQHYCEAQIPTGFSGRYRLSCIEDYVQSHGGAPAATIPDSLYKFDFVSPAWSPDLAGFCVIFTLLSLVSLITSVVARLVLRHSAQ